MKIDNRPYIYWFLIALNVGVYITIVVECFHLGG